MTMAVIDIVRRSSTIRDPLTEAIYRICVRCSYLLVPDQLTGPG